MKATVTPQKRIKIYHSSLLAVCLVTFIIFVTICAIFDSSSRFDLKPHWALKRIKQILYGNDENSYDVSKDEDYETDEGIHKPRKGFLVYSNSCQIPDVNPLDDTIQRLIEYKKPINCSSDYVKATYNVGTKLFIDYKLISAKLNNVTNNVVNCCYRSLHRVDGKSDNQVRISKKCIPLKGSETVINNEEFIKVECSYKDKVIYVNYHAFVPQKPDVERRCNQINGQQNSGNATKYSILIIGMDAVSRLNFHRQFQKTLQFLKEQLNVIEMYGYNKVGDNTFPNLIPALTGFLEEELKKVCWPKDNLSLDNCPFLWKKFAQNGYRTLYAEDSPKISSFNYVKKGFFHQPTDYYFRPLILKYEAELGRRKDLNCYMCVGPVSETEAILDWSKQFVERFHDHPFFAFLWINSMTHDFLNYGSMIDNVYHDYFNYLKSSELLNSTIVIVMSDHGLRWGKITHTYIGKLEERLPTLLFMLPPSFRQSYPNLVLAMEQNAYRLTTPLDLHATLQDLINFNGGSLSDFQNTEPSSASNGSASAISLFTEVPEARSCDDAKIAEHWCTCHRSEPVDKNDKEVVHVSEFLVENLNAMLNTSSKCAKLVLKDILDARLRSPTKHLKAESQYDISDYTVTIRTMPGGGVFEGTIRFVPEKHTHILLGSISRLNIYGHQSYCVKKANLRKYCYCKIQKHFVT